MKANCLLLILLLSTFSEVLGSRIRVLLKTENSSEDISNIKRVFTADEALAKQTQYMRVLGKSKGGKGKSKGKSKGKGKSKEGSYSYSKAHSFSYSRRAAKADTHPNKSSSTSYGKEDFAWGRTTENRFLEGSKGGKSKGKGKGTSKGGSYLYSKGHSYSYNRRTTKADTHLNKSPSTSSGGEESAWGRTIGDRHLRGSKGGKSKGKGTSKGGSYFYSKGHSYSYGRRVAKLES